jgi:hypothetical protein
MDNYVHLIGAEQIQNAANKMMEAAHLMTQASNNMCHAVQQQELTLSAFLVDFERLLDSMDEEEEE